MNEFWRDAIHCQLLAVECGAEDLVAAEESRSVETRGWSFNITIFKEGEGSNCYDFVTWALMDGGS